ncbi:hypothetical protein ACTMU2_00015 [Cupriavidus basilensis]
MRAYPAISCARWISSPTIRLVDLIGEGFDAGLRLGEALRR